MALSGSFGTNFSGNQYGGGYRLQVDWYATQNIANNTSTVRADLYLISLGSSWTINSSATKNVSLNINGVFSGGSGAGLASIGGNQKKFIWWHEVVVPHNTDGTKSLDITGVFDIAVTLSGQYYDTVRTSQTVYLDTIPRASSLTTAPDFTVGYSHDFAIARASSEFDHKVRLWVDGTQIKELNGQTTGGRFDFTDAEIELIFQKLNKTSSKQTRINVQTFKYGQYIGEKDYYGTCYNVGGGVITFNSFTFGNNLPVNISNLGKLKHTVKFYFGGTLIKTLTNVNAGASTVTWTDTEVNAMLAKIPTTTYGYGEAVVTSYWGSTQVWADIASGYTAYAGAKARPPKFTSNFTYKDTLTTGINTVGITGNNQHIIQGKSTLQVEILTANKAEAQDYSTMVEYVATLNGVEKKVAHSATATMTIDFGTVSASSNSTLTVKAVDSRGLSTSFSKTVTILPYSPPTVTSDVARRNNFETSTTIPCSGSMSSLNGKNLISSVQLRYKETIGGTFTSWENFVFANTVPTYSCTTLTKNLDNTKAWTLEVKVTDKLGTTTVTRTVSAGSPIFFIDWEKKTLGINKFPTSANNALEIAGHLDVDGIVRVKQDQWMSSSGAHGLDMRNSDIKGLNAIYFNDDSGASDEGLNFLKTGKAVGSTTIADYDNFCVVDGGLRLNQRTMFWQEGGVTSSNIRFGGDAYSYASGGTIFDIWGNIKGQPTAGVSNTFSIQDADGRTKFICPIGKGGTGATELHAHTGGIKFHHNGLNTWNLWNSGGGAYVHFDMGAGRMKWNGDNATFEFLNQSGGWAKVYGDWNSSSTRDVKKNIETYDDSALTMIKSTPTYQYHYLTDEDNRKKRLGLIVEESPKAVVSEDEKSIEMYSMTTLLWKAVQELSTKVDNLENRITMR
ncbi:tail protein [Bacillus phage vB_BanS_Chewbecca]|uniref:Minor structural protein n=1 Tax=Bacillus phage vB_BanS_Chewbecca TaxID=2894786 RepID=A0AAE8YR56_9CAUD|nr:tail protein [Bacillus phage vB_BanS_Chewbecca]UGO46265.1 minor structural protein [Bacillus phage vB_BanS_Chewbecca]